VRPKISRLMNRLLTRYISHFSGRLLVKFTRLQVAENKRGDEDVSMEAPPTGAEAPAVPTTKKALAKLGHIPKGPKVSPSSSSLSS
jgi:hypothetical protein